MSRPIITTWLTIASALLLVIAEDAAHAQDDAVAAVRKSAEQLAAAINQANSNSAAQSFLPKGEFIDEQGVVYQGHQEIRGLLNAFFQQFRGAKLSLSIESIRLVGPVAIEEGTRTMTTADGNERSRFRYIAVWARTEDGWRLASLRDFADDPLPTANDYLQPVAWLVGDWVNEGADGKVAISYRWSDDKNFLLGEFQMEPAEGTSRTSTQRIGWDPSVGKIRSWLFDSDGGFSEGTWTAVDDGIVIKSAAVNPNGTVATATMNIYIDDEDHFTIEGTDRIVGDSLDEDFSISVARRPPAAGN